MNNAQKITNLLTPISKCYDGIAVQLEADIDADVIEEIVRSTWLLAWREVDAKVRMPIMQSIESGDEK